MSDNGVPIETIADLVGHASTAVTEEVYRHQLKPVITRGAERDNERHLQAEPHQIRVRQWPRFGPQRSSARSLTDKFYLVGMAEFELAASSSRSQVREPLGWATPWLTWA
jgi:hypothetical protein